MRISVRFVVQEYIVTWTPNPSPAVFPRRYRCHAYIGIRQIHFVDKIHSVHQGFIAGVTTSLKHSTASDIKSSGLARDSKVGKWLTCKADGQHNLPITPRQEELSQGPAWS